MRVKQNNRHKAHSKLWPQNIRQLLQQQQLNIHPLTHRSAPASLSWCQSPAVSSLPWAFKCFQNPKGLQGPAHARAPPTSTPHPRKLCWQLSPTPPLPWPSILSAAHPPLVFFHAQSKQKDTLLRKSKLTTPIFKKFKNLFLKYHIHFIHILLQPSSLTMKILLVHFSHSRNLQY